MTNNQFLAAIAALVLALFSGCTGDPLTQDNGRPASIDAGASYDSSHDHGQPQQDTAICTPKCGGKNCGSNGCGGTCGTCQNDETCNGVSLCTPKSAAHICPTGSSCDNGERCWCDAAGSFTCYALTGMCVMDGGGKEACESTSSYTSTCGTGHGCVGADMSPKAAMCGVTCTGGQMYNVATGKCESGSTGNCKTAGCPSGLFCDWTNGLCVDDSSPGSPFVGYDHIFCAWASVKLTGVYGGQTNSVEYGALASMADWTYPGDDPKAGGWVQVGDKFCRGVTGIGRAVRILAQTKDGDFPGWVASSAGKKYSLPFTIYGSWDNGAHQGSANEASPNCEGGAPSKAICQYNKGSVAGDTGVVFPVPN